LTRKTTDVKKLLENREFDKFKEIIEYIIKNKNKFPQYDDDWFGDYEKELKQAQNNFDEKSRLIKI